MDNAKARGDAAARRSAPLQARFPALVRDVRGIGLMIGVEFDTHEHAAAVEWAAFQRGLLVLEAGHDGRADVAAARSHRGAKPPPACRSSARPSPRSRQRVQPRAAAVSAMIRE